MIRLEIQTPRTRTLRFMAGQRASLILEDGTCAELPIASCPCNGREIHFFVRLPFVPSRRTPSPLGTRRHERWADPEPVVECRLHSRPTAPGLGRNLLLDDRHRMYTNATKDLPQKVFAAAVKTPFSGH